jgi:type III pantothenate kinase
MFLAIDIGNTSIKFGIFEGERLTSRFSIPTVRDSSVADVADAVNGRLSKDIGFSLISSVVPEVDAVIAEHLFELSGVGAEFVTSADDFNLTFNFPVSEVGTDRLVNASTAAEKYGVPCISIAIGTATTIDVVGRGREFLGGLIAPGPGTSAKALNIVASKLPEVEIAAPTSAIGESTAAAIQAGIFYGQAGLIETAVRQIKTQTGDDAKVIATGGFASLIAGHCSAIDVIDTELTLEGLRMLYSRRLANARPHPE